MSVMNRLLIAAITAGNKTSTLYVTREEGLTLAREITDQLRPIGFDDVTKMQDVIFSDTALIFGQPLRIKKQETSRHGTR
jgi:hypothetical protein